MSKKEEARNDHPVLKTLTAAAVLGTAAYGGLSYYVFRTACDMENSDFSAKIPWKRSPHQAENDRWFAECSRQEDYLNSYDGLKLHATRIVNHPESHRWAIVLHGYHSCAMEMADYLHEFDQQRYNLLAPDLRACGLSRGRYCGLGWPEHYDLISWINFLVNLDPAAEIVLFGVSLGASAVMYALGDYLPKQVKCAVEDSGFSDAQELLEQVVADHLSIPGHPLMMGVDFFMKQNLHYSLNDVSIRRQLMQCRTPVLFMHGEADSLIPASMAYDCYYACQSEKQLQMFTGSGHAQCFCSEQYFPTVFEFIGRHIG